jgi:hypothetical protein
MGRELSKRDGPGAVRIREDVEVRAVMSDGTVTPLQLVIDGVALRLRVERAWLGYSNGVRLRYWSVVSGRLRFTLCYRADDLTWMVEELNA